MIQASEDISANKNLKINNRMDCNLELWDACK